MVTLGQALTSCPESVSRQKIVLNYRNIQFISYDIDEALQKSINKIYLSNNIITDLTGIEKFKSLTQISLANNKLEDFEQLLKLPVSVTSLSVNGNFVEKNPNLYLLLINRFPKLQEIDTYKVCADTIKTLNSSKNLKTQLIPLLHILDSKIIESKKTLNLIKVNLEVDSIFGTFESTLASQHINKECPFESKISRIESLLSKLELSILEKDLVNLKNKYLKPNINPSVYVISKIFCSVFRSSIMKLGSKVSDELHIVEASYQHSSRSQKTSRSKPKLNKEYSMNKKESYENLNIELSNHSLLSDFISTYFTNSSQPELSNLYFGLFKDIIRKFVIKGNYSALPTFLNYLVLKSNRDLYSFIIESVKKDVNYQDFDKTSKMDDYSLIVHISKNLDKVLSRYTNKSGQTLLKLQLIQFYLLDPASPKMTNLFNLEVIKPSTVTELIEEDSQDYKRMFNPLGLKLNREGIFPKRTNTKIAFQVKQIQYDPDYQTDYFREKLTVLKANKHFTEMKYHPEYILDLEPLEILAEKFIKNFPALEFPVFALNFDYMRVLTLVLQDRIKDYIDFFDEVSNIYNNLRDLKEKLLAQSRVKKATNTPNPSFSRQASKSKIDNQRAQLSAKVLHPSSKSNSKYQDNQSSSYFYIENHKDKLNCLKPQVTAPNPQVMRIPQNSYNTVAHEREEGYKKTKYNNLLIQNKAGMRRMQQFCEGVMPTVTRIMLSCLASYFKTFNNNIELKTHFRDLQLFAKRFVKASEHSIFQYKQVSFKRIITELNKRIKVSNKIAENNLKLKLKYMKLLNAVVRRLTFISKHVNSKRKNKAFIGLLKHFYNSKFKRQKTTSARLFYLKTIQIKAFKLIKFHSFIKYNIIPDKENKEIDTVTFRNVASQRNANYELHEESKESNRSIERVSIVHKKSESHRGEDSQSSCVSNPFIKNQAEECQEGKINTLDLELDRMLNKINSHIKQSTTNSFVSKSNITKGVGTSSLNTVSNIIPTNPSLLKQPSISVFEDSKKSKNASKASSKGYNAILGHPSYLKKTKSKSFKEF